MQLGYQPAREIMSDNRQASGYLNWHIADSGSGKGVRLGCFDEVAWVKNVFCKNGIQLDLVVGVDEEYTSSAGACILGVSL